MIEEFDRIRHNTEEVKNLLAAAVGYPTPEKLRSLLDNVYDLDGYLLFVIPDKDHVIGLIGIDISAAPHGWILHLAVSPGHLKRNIGRALIEQAMEKLALQSASLETNDDAVGFYRSCGFTVKEIPGKWPDVRRYRCTKGNPPESVLEYYHYK